MKFLFLLLVTMGFASADVSKVDVEEAEKLIGEKIQLLDIRTAKEWNEGRLEGAVRTDYYEDDFAKQVVKAVDPAKPVLIYCHSGGRSGKASKQMTKLGFARIYDLGGGIVAWKKAGKKVVK